MKRAAILLLLAVTSCSVMDRSAATRDDESIRAEVRQNLNADGFSAVTADVVNGVVTLSGHAATATFREKAVADAERSNGVKRIVDNITVP